MGSKNINVEYRLSEREIKRVNKEYDVGFGFDDTFQVDNYLSSIVSGANKMICRMVRNSSREKNCVLKAYKNLLRPLVDHCTYCLVFSV